MVLGVRSRRPANATTNLHFIAGLGEYPLNSYKITFFDSAEAAAAPAAEGQPGAEGAAAIAESKP